MSRNKPEYWCDASIGDIGTTITGITPSSGIDGVWGGGLPFFKPTDLNAGYNVRNGRQYLTEKAKKYVHVLPANSILVTCIGATIGKSGIARVTCATNQQINALITNRRLVTPEFVYWALVSPLGQKQIKANASATTLPILNKTKFEKITLPVASIPEQKRIVEAIEDHFSRLDEAVMLLERVRRNLKRYRASVLKAAVEGRLVPTEAELARAEGRDFEPASVLLERILACKRKDFGQPDVSDLPQLPQGWCWTKIGNVGQVQLGRQRSPKNHHGPHMRPYLRVANVFEDRIDISDMLEMNFSPAEYKTYRLEPGDILLNEGQSPHLVGRPAMYRGEVPGSCFQNTLVRFRACVGVDPKYALIVFLSQLHSLRYLPIAKITTNIAHLGAERFANVEFPLPPLEEQIRIVQAVEKQTTEIDAIQKTIYANLGHCARLKQSILKHAFEGKLVEQDPSDEPASVLLERIRAERAAAEAERKPRIAKRKAGRKKVLA